MPPTHAYLWMCVFVYYKVYSTLFDYASQCALLKHILNDDTLSFKIDAFTTQFDNKGHTVLSSTVVN